MVPDLLIAVDPGLASGVAVIAHGPWITEAGRETFATTGLVSLSDEVDLAELWSEGDHKSLVKVYSAESEWQEVWTTLEVIGQSVAQIRAIASPARPIRIKVAAERFVISSATARKTAAPWSLEVIGQVRGLAWKYGLGPVTLQDAASAKNLVTNTRLKGLGLWHRGGEGHAMDALRHGAFCCVNSGWRGPGLSD